MFTGFLGNLKTQKNIDRLSTLSGALPVIFSLNRVFFFGFINFSAVPRYKSPKNGNRIDSAVAVVADISFYDQMIAGLLSLDIFISGYI